MKLDSDPEIPHITPQYKKRERRKKAHLRSAE
jgi:hypothetical protein